VHYFDDGAASVAAFVAFVRRHVARVGPRIAFAAAAADAIETTALWIY
jgi:hypothetical protein